MPSRTEGATPFFHSRLIDQLCVILLVLLEYGLRQVEFHTFCHLLHVLILILLEYGLRPDGIIVKGNDTIVLILILLEYGLRPLKMRAKHGCLSS